MLLKTKVNFNKIPQRNSVYKSKIAFNEVLELPIKYYLNLELISKERIYFLLDCITIIGPYNNGVNAENCDEYIKAIEYLIEGEAKILFNDVNIKDLINNRKFYEQLLLIHIQESLNNYGKLSVCYMGLGSPRDTPGYNYIEQIKRNNE